MKPWSISANNTFKRCQRQYFFQYIMAHHSARDSARREAHQLKQLSSIDEWRGKLLHLVLERYFVPSLQRRKLIEKEKLLDITKNLAKNQYNFSREKKYRNGPKSKAGEEYLALHGHEYDIIINNSDIDDVYNSIDKCIEYLYDQESLLNYLLSGGRYYPECNIRFNFSGIPVIAKIDLIVKFPNSAISVIDWKFSKSVTSDYEYQLLLYAYAILQGWDGYRVQDITVIEANLLKGAIVHYKLNDDKISSIEDYIYRNISNIRITADGNDYSKNNLMNFEYARSSYSCKFCKFQKLCVRMA